MPRAVWCPTCNAMVPVLSEREVQVLRGIAKGRTNEQIGGELHLSPHTVANYLAGIYSAIGVHNRVEATLYAVSNGIVKPKKAHLHVSE